MDGRFRDRTAAGRQLAERLAQRPGLEDAVVLALPRGGVPVGYEIAKALGAELDVMVVRKLGVPGHEELAMGAIASGGVRIMNEDVLEMLYIPEAVIERTAAREQAELERRERAYRGGREAPRLSGRPVILVDDGVATGSTMRAAIRAVRQQRPERVLVAVPVAPPEVCELLAGEADEVVCLLTPEPFIAISVWYDSFPQLGDDEVRALLAEAARTARERGSRPA
ncbi:MAG TPA: phosphoribosyltransferase [Longimicrobiales bacterium]